MDDDVLVRHCQRASKLMGILAARVQAHAGTGQPAVPQPAASGSDDCGHADLLQQCHDFREAFEALAERYVKRLGERDTVEAMRRTVDELRSLLADETRKREVAERAAETSRVEFSRMLDRLLAVQATESKETADILAYVRQLELENATLRRLAGPLTRAGVEPVPSKSL